MLEIFFNGKCRCSCRYDILPFPWIRHGQWKIYICFVYINFTNTFHVINGAMTAMTWTFRFGGDAQVGMQLMKTYPDIEIRQLPLGILGGQRSVCFVFCWWWRWWWWWWWRLVLVWCFEFSVWGVLDAVAGTNKTYFAEIFQSTSYV